ncbi:Sulfate permease [hydrothermal vent metagenome]|uniref:Sulfate permease n=1 Tax=hydrothermal vent metagenome TaxID=652676 RepID=A0A3B1DJN9_9ZZZZ
MSHNVPIIAEKKTASIKTDLLSGLTVALALVPEAVAFAIIAKVDPLVGLYAAFIMAIITSLIGGRPGMISGATGAIAVVTTALVVDHGIQYLFAAVILMGIIQILAGVFKLGKFIRLVPHPVMLGFVNGLAIIIGLSQLEAFQINVQGTHVWMQGTQLYTMLSLVAFTMLVIHFFPKFTKKFPAALAGILACTGVVLGAKFLGYDMSQVTFIPKFDAILPSFGIPSVPHNFETFKTVLPFALIMASIGLIESLMTLTLIDEMTDTRGRGNKECVGQGVANVVTGFFGGMGGCAMIGQSVININSGGRGRLSGLTAGVFLLCMIMFLGPLIALVPMAALIAVMFTVVIGTFAWPSLRILHKIPFSDAFVIVLVSVVTVISDLAVAVFIGVVVSALVFTWKKSKDISAQTTEHDGVKNYILDGALFFGSITNFNNIFTPSQDPKVIHIDFLRSRVFDHSAIEAINKLAEKYEALGKEIHLKHLSKECSALIAKAGHLVDVNILEDPDYHVADDDLA